MPTENPRIQVTLDDMTLELLKKLAKIQDKSNSSCAASLIKEALELYEDKVLSRLADERIENHEEWVSHEEVWGKEGDEK